MLMNEAKRGEAQYWWKNATIYELYVDKFAGDFKGLTTKLDYLVSLGINTLHILPHYPSPMIDEGYDITDYRNVRPELGTLDDMRECIAQAKARGIHIILDMVLNHVSSQHPWFIAARSSKDDPKRGYFLWSETGTEYPDSLNAFPDIKPSNWIADPLTGDFYFATFYPEQPDLNWDNPEVVEGMLANMDFWAEMGVDGFRLDAACFLIKRAGTNCKGLPETHAMIKRIRKHLDEKYPRGVVLLGEAAQSIEETKAYFGDGDECQLMYNFPLMAEMWLSLKDGNPSAARRMSELSNGIPETCEWATFVRNHDEIELRFLESAEVRSGLLDFLDPAKEYLFNKGVATSKRIASIFTDKKDMLAAFELLYALPGAPVMYYGDEIGMRNLPVMVGIVDTRKYVRGPFDWVEAERQEEDPSSLLVEVRRVIANRNTSL